MRRYPRKAAAALIHLAGPLVAAAQPQTAPQLPDGPLRINITAVSGMVSARQDDSQPWSPVQPGQVFDEGVELRTGPKSAVKFDIPPASSITLDRLGTVKVVRAAIESGTIKTDLGMKYGRARYDIETAGREYDAKIRSASSVLSIRGTDVILDDTPGFEVRAVSVTGRARYTDPRGNTVPLGSPGATSPARIEGDAPGAPGTGLQDSIATSPIDLARTPDEFALITTIPPAAGLPPPPPGARQTQLFLASAGGGSVALPPGQTVPTPVPPEIAGRLEFVLGWTGDADLQIGVISALGEPITTNPANVLTLPSRATGPAGLSSPSGGVASADATGGAAGSFVETVTWANGFPAGAYDYGVKYASGRGAANYSLDVLVNGVRLDPPVSGTLAGPTPSEFTGQTVQIEPVVPSVASGNRPSVGKKRRK